MGACPEGLPVFQMMGLLQLYEVFRLSSAAPQIARLHGNERRSPTKCVACGACVEACPQEIPVPERMERLAALAEELSQDSE
jgi:L-lactate utilization protein LutB